MIPIAPVAEAGFDSAPLTRDERYFSEIGGVRRFLAEIPGSRSCPRTGVVAPVVIEHLLELHGGASNRYLAAKNGFLVLDTIYNLGLFTGRDAASRVLAARRRFLALLHHSAPDPRPGRVHFIPPRHVQLVLALCRLVPGRRGRAVRDALRMLRIRRLTASVFAEHACQRLAHPETGRRLDALRTVLQGRLRECRQGHPPGENLWQLCRRLVSHSVEAVELLGVFGSQHRTLRKTVLALVTERERYPRLLDSLHHSAEIFFLIQEIGECELGESGVYRFAYPEGFHSRNPRFYHFWSAAFLAAGLRAAGHSTADIRWVSRVLARSYETYTLPWNLIAAGRMGASLTQQLRNWKLDVASHQGGAEFALLVAGAR